MKRTAILIMVLTILSKIIGFARDIILSYFYGISIVSDAYIISTTIPMVIFGFIGTGIATGYIPMYNRIKQSKGIEEADRYTSNLVNALLVICTIIVLLSSLFTEQIVRVFASGFNKETMALAIQFTRISLVAIYFMGLIYVFNGFLQIKGNYVIPALIGLPFNFFIILSIIISANTNVTVLAIGSVVAAISQLVLVLPYAFRQGYRYKPILNLKDEDMKNMAYIALPVMLGVSVNHINTLVDRTIASQIAIGGISALNYAYKLNGFIHGMFVLSISTAMYPLISKMAAEKNIVGLKKAASEAVSSINLLVVPATIGAMMFAEPIVNLLFGRGAFDAQAIAMTSNALFFYSIGMIGYGIREVLSRVFYSLQDTKTPMINAAVAMLMNIVLNIILSRFMGIGGLALATSISAIFCTIILFFSLRKKIGALGIKNMLISFIKILAASLVMGIVSKVLYNSLAGSISTNLSLVLSIAVGALVYFATIYFMKIEDVDDIVKAIKVRFKKTSAKSK